jgi:hypothetical protein
MKKFLYLFLFLLFGLSLVNAQTENTPEYKYKLFNSIGFFVGGDYSSLTGDAPTDASYARMMGFIGGVSVEFNIKKDIKILLQPMYDLKYSKMLFDKGGTDPVDSMRFRFEYFRAPLLAKINAFNGVTYFLSGFDFGLLLKSSGYDVNKINGEKDLSNYVNKFDLSALFGIGVNFKIKSKDLYLEIRYSQSLLNMSSNNTSTFGSDLPSRFRFTGFNILTGFNFNL